MTLHLTVNGRPVAAEVEPRTHLADFLRETLTLTGTHLGCEHGVCGACTLLLDEQPVRGCITFAALCAGRAVRSIEGLAEDAVMVALRAAFTAEHALQCGYCTPGMLITARDIVLRLPGADDARIRLELAGNLCRCTGYVGIVRAIRRVLDAPPPIVRAAPPTLPPAQVAHAAPALPDAPPAGPTLAQSLRLALPVETVWAAVQDPALVAACVPGVTITAAEGAHLAGTMSASLGPLRARFTGEATLRFDPAFRSGRIAGSGRDAASQTLLSAAADFALLADGTGGTLIQLDIGYALQGRLAQFGRGPVVRVFATALAVTVAANLEARLRGRSAPPRTLSAGLMLRTVWRALRGYFGG